MARFYVLTSLTYSILCSDVLCRHDLVVSTMTKGRALGTDVSTGLHVYYL